MARCRISAAIGVERGKVAVSLVGGEKRAGETVARQGDEIIAIKVERIGNGGENGVHITAEIGRIVRIDRRVQALSLHGAKRMRGQIGNDAQLEVG